MPAGTRRARWTPHDRLRSWCKRPTMSGVERLVVIDMTVELPDSQVIQNAVALASRAPSLHNSQPWRWVSEGASLQLRADRNRAMPATDHTGRELMLSCGAVLDHLRVAMAAAGWDSTTERFPEPDDPDHLATLQFRPCRPPRRPLR